MKCPYCNKPIDRLAGKDIKVTHEERKAVLKCIAYSCEHCRSVLSVQIDPIAIAEGITTSINRRIAKAK